MLTATYDDDASVSKLFLGETEILKNSSNNWTVSGNVVTIKTAYLDTLADGENTFTLKFSDNTSANFGITVSDTTPEPVEGE